MSGHAQAQADRLRQYQAEALAFHTCRGEGDSPLVDLLVEPRHPILNRPRLVVTLRGAARPADVEEAFRLCNLSELYQMWWEKSGERAFRPCRKAHVYAAAKALGFTSDK